MTDNLFQDIQSAGIRIAPHVIRTPLIYSSTFSRITNAHVYLKLETLQKAGSFKIRGAMNKILIHANKAGPAGVVTASAGNHAQGVSVAAQIAGIPATVIMPFWSSLSKQEASRGYGADVHLFGKTLEESMQRARELADEGMLYVHPFDDPEIIAGQGTIGLEICDALPSPDIVVVPVGGGGLISGISVAVKNKVPSCRIIGVQVQACPSAYQAKYGGGEVSETTGWTLADGIRVTRTGTHSLPYIRDMVDQIVLVDDGEISDAMLWLLERKKIVAEGAGTTPLAALLSQKFSFSPGSTIVLVISGGNIDSHQLSRVIRQALARRGRLMRLSLVIEDQPGSLAEVLAIIAREGGNILKISHSEWDIELPVHEKRIWIEIETRGPSHIAAIEKVLSNVGIQTSGFSDEMTGK
ncbi:L-threonine ammonia-lyase [Methanospirillum hungatei JF-1]|uniref:threonine ammonia-lyase n=1 Tax=Methanospirillum hungatei JF-1 (strain ATCC 27890 / DSM 864 / NBRC 100397 / JF-1) TaxID=323259 RepID=Q2FRH4_METHJ|nr:threonine ammonia-lyase [Methanospirillum hungatei]ABD41650.1 L-threonine ammonia-lyase [Methanospirillum hungatei JF-1]